MNFDAEEKSVVKFGSIITIVVGVLYFVVAVMIGMDPVGLYLGSVENYRNLMETPTLNMIWRVLFATLCLLSIAYCNALTTYVKKGVEKYAGIIKWIHVLLVASMIISAMNWIHYIHMNSVAIGLYREGTTYEALINERHFPTDSYYFFSWGVYGFGYFVLNIIALIEKKFSKKMCWLGIVVGLQCMTMVFVYVSGFDFVVFGVSLNLMIVISGTLAGITAPIYHFASRKYFLEKAAIK
jgi:hypothetical protein